MILWCFRTSARTGVSFAIWFSHNWYLTCPVPTISIRWSWTSKTCKRRLHSNKIRWWWCKIIRWVRPETWCFARRCQWKCYSRLNSTTKIVTLNKFTKVVEWYRQKIVRETLMDMGARWMQSGFIRMAVVLMPLSKASINSKVSFSEWIRCLLAQILSCRLIKLQWGQTMERVREATLHSYWGQFWKAQINNNSSKSKTKYLCSSNR